jgi:hypothetical protein
VVLTVLFTGTGLYSLLRWASLRAGVAGHHGDQVAELSHLVMSLAMVGMVWGYGGGAADTVQLVAFGAFSCYFLARLVLGRVRPALAGCPAPGFHLVMAASMVWMVAAMPLLMAGMATGSGGGGPAVTETPGWALALTVLFCVALLVGVAYWARQLRPARFVDAGAAARPADDLPVVEFGNHRPIANAENLPPVQLGNHRPIANAENLPPVQLGNHRPIAGAENLPVVQLGNGKQVGGRTATLQPEAPAAPARGRVLAALTPRADATCHLAMSLGMVAMFLVML